MRKPTLYIFSGLPGTGKSTLAKRLAAELSAAYFRVDTLEQGLRDVCKLEKIEGEGYRLSHLLAQENLKVGNHVVADSVNPWELTRKDWNEVASSVGASFVNIEIWCSNVDEHKKRVESRNTEIPNLKLPTWEQVLKRDYRAWNMPRIQIDTAGKSPEQSFQELLQAVTGNVV